MPIVYRRALYIPIHGRRRAAMLATGCLLVLGLTGVGFVTAPVAHATTPSPPPGCDGCLMPTDEIQVYDASINEVGKWNLTWHNNFTPQGESQPDFPGGVVPNHTLNGVPEWAYGVKPWLEVGAYVPIYSYTASGRLLFEGVKLRTLFVVPHADQRKFFYGVNFEYSYNRSTWDTSQFSGEIRGIVGTHLGHWDLIVNPVVDTGFNGFKNLTFGPEARVAYNFSPKVALAAEWYAEFGAFPDFLPPPEQGHTLFGVIDLGGSSHGIEFGVGHGLSRGTATTVIKLMFMQDL
jgi:hypothetical protein